MLSAVIDRRCRAPIRFFYTVLGFVVENFQETGSDSFPGEIPFVGSLAPLAQLEPQLVIGQHSNHTPRRISSNPQRKPNNCERRFLPPPSGGVRAHSRGPTG